MSFINPAKVAVLATLKNKHYGFPRADDLRRGLQDVLEDYCAKASLGKDFEARGLLVTGPSRVGKTTELRKLIGAFNGSDTIMPDGRPAKIASVMLKGTLTWKDLGIYTLKTGMGFPSEKRMTQHAVWHLVQAQAKAQGVVGIHFDECQHIFPKEGRAERSKILDSFKSLLKDPDWPMVLILSGVDELAGHTKSDEQIDALLDEVAFPEINLNQREDVEELNTLCHAYAEMVGLDFSDLASIDFFQRLALACADRWGLVIELLISALVNAVLAGGRQYPVRAFLSGVHQGHPVSARDLAIFDQRFREAFRAPETRQALG